MVPRIILRLIGAFFCCLLALQPLHAQGGKGKKTAPITPEAQLKIKSAEDTLLVLAFAIVNDSDEMQRFTACRAFISYLVQTLKTPSSFQYPFSRLNSISILCPPDSSFRVFSWQLFVNDSTYRYYGAIQMNTTDLKLFPLIDRSFEMEDDAATSVLPPDKWYGALYYHLMELDAGRNKQYLLFGFDAFHFYEKRKVLEVLQFDEKGEPSFGTPIFNRKTADEPMASEPDMRMILQYAAEAPIRLNWDELYQMILFDHLIPIPSPYGQGLVMVPDGSYDGFKVAKGRLEYVDKVFNDVNESVPMPEPILDKRKGKDITGRKKKE